MSNPNRIKPVIILPPGQMEKSDILILRRNGFCVVEAKDPSAVRFFEPPPNGYSEQEKAAIKLCRWIMGHPKDTTYTRQGLASTLAFFFMEGSPLLPVSQAVVAAAEIQTAKKK